MQYTINQLYQHLHGKVDTIYDTFKGFFGEAYVDLQEYSLKDRNDINAVIIDAMEHQCIILDYDDTEFTKSYEIKDKELEEIETFFKDVKTIIYVWFPTVTVTNENDKSINIQDLYAKIVIQWNGRIPYENWGFTLNRSTYTKEQFLSDYVHSHVQHIPKDNFTRFMHPCLGKGPIKDTIGTLKNEYNEITWMLFCQELSMYVTVESLAGVPWKHLEEVGKRSSSTTYTGYNFNSASPALFRRHFFKDKLKDFIEYYLKHGHLSISYINGKFVSGLPYYEYIIDVSNTFIDFYNESLRCNETTLNRCYDSGLLNQVIVSNGKFYKQGDVSHSPNLDRYKDKLVLRFKGKDIKLKILEGLDTSEVTITTVIDHNLAMYVLKNILRTINFRYRNEYKYKDRRSEAITPTLQRVFYL